MRRIKRGLYQVLIESSWKFEFHCRDRIHISFLDPHIAKFQHHVIKRHRHDESTSDWLKWPSQTNLKFAQIDFISLDHIEDFVKFCKYAKRA